MFSKYYQAELTYLREVGRAFAGAHPALAGLLAERGADPDVERLLEGFAFLSARIRERLDAGVPEVVHGLTELLLPHYLRPVPACTVMEFTPLPRVLRARSRLPRGTQVASVPVDGTSCLFTTTQAVDLVPLTLSDTVLDTSVAQAPVLRVGCQTTEQGRPEVLHPDGLRLYLNAEYPAAATLLLWLSRSLRAVRVRDAASGREVRLPPTVVRPVGTREDCALLEWPARAPDAVRLVQEYFTLPQKFLFVDVVGLEQALPVVGERFELAFEFERPHGPPPRLGRDALRLHCAPAINLFPCSGDPLLQRAPGEEHLLRAAGVDPRHMEVSSVESVRGLRAGRAERREYPPYVAFEHTHPAGGGAGAPAFYRVRRARSPVDGGLDTYLSVGTPGEVVPEVGEETLSVELRCTNRGLPARLQVGDLSVSTPESPTLARFRNITPVSKPLRPPLGPEMHWRLLSHVALNQGSLADAAALRALLGLYNFQGEADAPAARANQLRVEALREVRALPAHRVRADGAVRGMRVEVQLDDSRFASPGDAFVFGEVLDGLFGASVTLNSFSELVLHLQSSQTRLSWTPRSGSQPLL